MRSSGGGYTIIEVMIFLAISALIFFAAIIAVGGEQAHTQFRTATNDVNTKIQQLVDQVVNGFTGSTSTSTPIGTSATCDTTGVGNYPALSLITGKSVQRGANDQCVFLGKALQVTDVASAANGGDPQHIYVYTVLGRRLDGNALVTDLVDARPSAETNAGVADLDLFEDYVIPNGAQVLWVKDGPTVANLNNTGHLAGFYASINGGFSGNNGSQTLLAQAYSNLATNFGPRAGTVQSCIQFQNPCTVTAAADQNNPFPMHNWVICLESTRNSDTAAIDVVSNAGIGVSTKVLIPCPGS